MAKNQKKTPTPTGIHFEEHDGDFKLYKRWGRDKTSKDPFFITDDLEAMIEELNDCCTKWRCKVNLKELKRFINTHKPEENEEANIPKSYFSQ